MLHSPLGFISTFIIAMHAFFIWKTIATVLFITIRTVSANDSEDFIADYSPPSSPNEPGNIPVKDPPQPSTLKSPNDAASLLAYNYGWVTDDLAQVPNQHLDDPDSVLLANEDNLCQSSPDQSQTTWRRRRARMRRDAAPGKFCPANSQQIQSGDSVGQQSPAQLQNQKLGTGEQKVKTPPTLGREGKTPSSLTEFEQGLEIGGLKMGQTDSEMCSRATQAKRNMPVCYIGYPIMPREFMAILPQVRAGELTSLFLAPQILSHHIRRHKTRTNNSRIIKSNRHGGLV